MTTIRRLTLRRSRQFEDFTWEPQVGINCLIGPGDAGKTTVLEAIARATSPSPYGPAAEHDYFRRRTDAGFEIELRDFELAATKSGDKILPPKTAPQNDESPAIARLR